MSKYNWMMKYNGSTRYWVILNSEKFKDVGILETSYSINGIEKREYILYNGHLTLGHFDTLRAAKQALLCVNIERRRKRMEIKVFDGQTLIRSFQFPIGYYANKMADLGYETVEFCLEVKKNESFIIFSNHAKEQMIYVFPDKSFRKELWEDIPSEVTYEEMLVIKDMLDFIASH